MTRRPRAFCSFLLCAILLAGCSHSVDETPASAPSASIDTVSGGAGTSASSSAYPLTFADDAGHTVTLESQPQNVAVLFSSYAELWAAAGGQVSVTVGDSIERGYADAGTPLVDDGAGMNIDAEALLAHEPDFVIASADMAAQADVCDQLSALGIPCAAFREDSVEDYVRLMDLFTQITGQRQGYMSAVAVADACAEIIRQAESAAGSEPVKVLFIRAGSGYSSTRAKTAKDHFVGQMLAQLGVENIADQAGALSEGLSLESVLVNQPDVILIVPQGDETATRAYMDSVLAEAGWRDLTAVQEGRCHYLEKDLYHFKPNSRWAEAYSYLYDLLFSAEAA